MSKHAANTASTTKKILAAGGLAFGVASLGLFASAGTAAADGHTIPDPDATWGAPDGAEVRETSWVPAVNEGDMVYAVHSIDTSADVLGANTPVSSWPYAPIWDEDGFQSYITSSWPARGWGVADN
jgi:hypothetical protein